MSHRSASRRKKRLDQSRRLLRARLHVERGRQFERFQAVQYGFPEIVPPPSKPRSRINLRYLDLQIQNRKGDQAAHEQKGVAGLSQHHYFRGADRADGLEHARVVFVAFQQNVLEYQQVAAYGEPKRKYSLLLETSRR